MDQTFQIHDFLQIFKKHIKIIFIIPLLFAFIGAIISLFIITPVYEARSDLLVNNTVSTSEEALTASDIETNLRLIETYQFIIKSDRIIDLVTKELDKSFTNNEVRKKLRVETNDNAQIISLYVKDTDLEMAVDIANLFASTFQTEIINLMNIENVYILTEAKANKQMKPVTPKPFLYIIISLLVGLLFACIYAILSAYFNMKIGTKKEIEKYLDIPFLGEVWNNSYKRKKRLKLTQNDDLYSLVTTRKIPIDPSVVDAYRSIRTNIQFQFKIKSLKTILITSTSKNDSKTITSGNLAVIMALDNKKTVVIDADLRKKQPEKSINKIGLTSFLVGHHSLDDILLNTTRSNLQIIESGPILPNSTELLSSERMNHLLHELKERFDQIIIDSPPLFFSDAAILATKVDGCILVIQSNRTKVSEIKQGLEQLTNINATVLGAILNKKKKIKKSSINSYKTR